MSVTSPVNPAPAVTVMVELPLSPTRTLTDAGVAERLKANTVSGTLMATEGTPALVPLMFTLYVPGVVVLHVSEEVVEVDVTIAGTWEQTTPVEGVTVSVNVTAPVKPVDRVIVMVDEAGLPERTVRELGLAERRNAWTENVTFVARVEVPSLAET